MQLLIEVPPFLLSLLEHLSTASAAVSLHFHIWTERLSNLSIPRNAVLPLTVFLIFFWPVVLTLVMTIMTGSKLIFWLLTSVVFGVLQLGYVTYQFFMIATDIMGLSVLKTYSMLRSQIVWYLDKSGSIRKGRRRLWRQNLEQASNYENFLKIRIEHKDEATVTVVAPKRVDAALPPPAIPRTKSFTDMNSSDEESPSKRKSSSVLRRNRSFSGEAHIPASLAYVDPVAAAELGERTADLLATTTSRMREARLAAEENPETSTQSLVYLLSAVLKRNHLKLDDFAVENARSIALTGQYGLTAPSRSLIRSFYDEVEKGLDWLAESPLTASRMPSPRSEFEPETELSDRINLIRKMRQNMGRTALMLSGGGAQAMYHMGVIRALLESKQYDDISVISGTSGGSIIAGMCAMATNEELYRDVCVPTVSTDFRGTGEMKKNNIRWFPPMMEMAGYWLKNKLLVDGAYFRRTCEFYFGDTTFEEAFERTGKHVCITVSASRASGDTAQRLLLNHISTPHVTIASAVAASCALPGVMAPAKLIAKNSSGDLEPFEVDGVEWIDGSVQADLPFQRIATLFAVSSFIVSQTNFHVVPFLNKAHHPSRNSLYWRVFQTLEWDIRSRALKLGRLGLFPRIFGQDVSKVFKQKYHGNLTIVPRFTTMQTFGLQALSNPTVKDMEHYIKNGQIATWPYLNAIRDMIRLEKALDDCMKRLEDRLRTIAPDVDWSAHDDIDSIASSSAFASQGRAVRIIGRPPMGISMKDKESDRMKKRVVSLEQENQALRQQLEELKKKMAAESNHEKSNGENGTSEPNDKDEGEECKVHQQDGPVSLSDGSEGAIWGLVLGRMGKK